jgi:hydrogenase maturation protein HypF
MVESQDPDDLYIGLKDTQLDILAARIHIVGIVQGVGFRPFVYNMAMRNSLTGWVRNSSAGVDIFVEGSRHQIDAFLQQIVSGKPPLAFIDDIQHDFTKPKGYESFDIIPSMEVPGAFQPISPDVSICPDCLAELFDPMDMRYRYPFINCTNCGPRFTIIQGIPYDRPNTTMASFELCQDCLSQYLDPHDRRFHAQPVACPKCGPHVWLEVHDDYQWVINQSLARESQTKIQGDFAINMTQQLLSKGAIVAIKGLGGFHLACDAMNIEAVNKLRQRKLRVDKPFALMMPDIATIEQHCYISDAERKLLESRERPIVILQRRKGSHIAEKVAPNQHTLGVMLPYTPLHYLLFVDFDELRSGRYIIPDDNKEETLPPSVLVMTSGNLSEEPIAIDNKEARQRLNSLADAFLMHNRLIYTRTDDSVMRVFDKPAHHDQPQATYQHLRRSRGYAPHPIRLPWNSQPILATGAELKNTFCLTRDQYAFISHHIGDLENYETLRAFEDGIDHFEKLFLIRPEIIAYDLHPDYLATRYALDRSKTEGLTSVGVQHHHAHIAACMLEHRLPASTEVIGVAFDGTGYGDDGAIWGGEFLLSSYQEYRRLYHLTYAPLPGGDLAIREPWRMALAWLDKAGVEWDSFLPPIRYVMENKKNPDQVLMSLSHQIKSGLNSPPTSSIGRLFDAVSALIGVRQEVNYEAQAAIEMEQLIAPNEFECYPFNFSGNDHSIEGLDIDATPAIRALVNDIYNGIDPRLMAARFHRGLAEMICKVCLAIRQKSGSNIVALSGGVWHNLALLSYTYNNLNKQGFTVLIHQHIPPNDGGISIGQAAVAFNKLKY